MGMNGTHQFAVCAEGAYILGGKINSIKKNPEALLEVRMEVGLEVNTEKI
jgi:hypothetical protein